MPPGLIRFGDTPWCRPCSSCFVSSSFLIPSVTRPRRSGHRSDLRYCWVSLYNIGGLTEGPNIIFKIINFTFMSTRNIPLPAAFRSYSWPPASSVPERRYIISPVYYGPGIGLGTLIAVLVSWSRNKSILLANPMRHTGMDLCDLRDPCP